MEPEPVELADDRIGGAGHFPRRIEVLYAEQPFAAVRACVEVAAERSHQ
jgi:hypothetical protein